MPARPNGIVNSAQVFVLQLAKISNKFFSLFTLFLRSAVFEESFLSYILYMSLYEALEQDMIETEKIGIKKSRA